MISTDVEKAIRFILLAMFGSAVLTFASPAAAQSTEELAAARELVLEGERAAGAGDTERARELFRDAFDLSREPRLLYRVAELDEELQNPARAVRHYELYLQLEPDAPYRERIEARINRLNETLDDVQTWIVVESHPAEAMVFVSEARRMRCETPCRVAVDPGESKIIVEKEGYSAAERMIYAASGESKTETFDLEALRTDEEPELAVEETVEKTEEPVEKSERAVPFEVEESQIDYIRSGPSSFMSLVGWTALLTGFWSVIVLVSPALPEATTGVAISGALGLGLGSYLLFIHPWDVRDDPAHGSSQELTIGVQFDF